MSRLKIPGPGNRLYTTWKFMRNPFVCYRQWRAKYGDTFLVKALNGDVVATSNRENIRRIFAAPSDSLGQFAVGTIKPLVGGTSLFLVEGTQHRRQRALLSPSFHGERIAGQAKIIRDVALRAGSRWQAGETVRIMDSALDVSLEVIIRVVFGVQTQPRVEAFKEKIRRFVASFHPALAFSRLFQRPLLGLSPWNRFLQSRDELDRMIAEEISNRRLSHSHDDNLLSRLLTSKSDDDQDIPDSTIRDHLVTLLLAGHETTQIAMAWAMSWLHRNPSTLIQLREELNSVVSPEEVLRCPYLEGVCNESLRLNSVVSDTVRKLKQPMELVNQTLPTGTNLAIPICLVHEDPEIYPDPFRFQPERWQGFAPKPNEFLPFGGGIRRCIGATLAMLEMKITIATWVTNFEFHLPAGIPDTEPVYRRNVTMAPRSGIPLVFVGSNN